MIQPTIGRQVWYWTAGTDPKDPAAQPQAATVCYVHGDSLVNLQVLDHNGCCRAETSVSLRQPNDPPWTPPYCEWMPYQKGQAQKTDELAAAIASGQPGKTADER